LFFGRERLDLKRPKEEPMARLPHHPKVATRIVFEDNADVLLTFVILFDTFDSCDLSLQREVQNVSAIARTQSHTIARSNLDAADHDILHLRLVFEEVPFPLIHGVSSLC
jgi:hypothetical protein